MFLLVSPLFYPLVQNVNLLPESIASQTQKKSVCSKSTTKSFMTDNYIPYRLFSKSKQKLTKKKKIVTDNLICFLKTRNKAHCWEHATCSKTKQILI